MKRFECVDDHKAAGFAVSAACEAAGVSRSGYYDWVQRQTEPLTHRQVEEGHIVALMRDIFDASDGNYGVPRMQKALRRAGYRINHKQMRRLMRLHEMAGRVRRRRVNTTVRGPDG